MSKVELVAAIAEKTGTTKKAAAEALNGIIAVITETVSRGEDIALTGFGSFKVVERPARICANPKTREKVSVPAKNVVKFKAGKALRESVKQA